MKNGNFRYFLSFILFSLGAVYFYNVGEYLLFVFCDLLLIVVLFSFVYSPIARKNSVESINNINFEGYKSYFRDIIKKYSIAELSYLDEFELNNPKDIISVLLKLEKNNIIEIKDGRINVIDSNNASLKKSEKYLIDNIRDGYLVLDSDLDYIYIVESECEKDNLIKKFSSVEEYKKTWYKNSSYSGWILGLIILSILVLFILLNVNMGFYFNIMGVIIAFLLLLFAVIVIPVRMAIESSKMSNKLDVRGYLLPEGKEVYNRLNGLKNYLREFGNIKDKESEHIILWDDYLIYSVFFNINKSIIAKYSKFIKIKHYYTSAEISNMEVGNSDFYQKNVRYR